MSPSLRRPRNPPVVTGTAVCTPTGLFDLTWVVRGAPTIRTRPRPSRARPCQRAPRRSVGEGRQHSIRRAGRGQGLVKAGSYTQAVEVQWTNHREGDVVPAKGSVNTSGACGPAQPPTETTRSEWSDTQQDSDAKTVTQTRTKVVTSYAWTDGKWVKGSPVVTTETQTRPMTEQEKRDCYLSAAVPVDPRLHRQVRYGPGSDGHAW